MAFIAKVSTMVASGHFGSAETQILMKSATVFLQPFLEIRPTPAVVTSSLPSSGSEWQRMRAGVPVPGCPNVGNKNHECSAYCREKWGGGQSAKSAYPPSDGQKDIEIVR
jgi:hypothetical protein